MNLKDLAQRAARHAEATQARLSYYANRPQRRARLKRGSDFRSHTFTPDGRCFHATKGRRPMWDRKAVA